jgi:hypothetical protein
MFVKIMKWLAAAILMWGGLGLFDPAYRILLGLVVCFAAIFVFRQALNANKLIWAAGFLAIAVIYNPVVPIRFSSRVFLWLDWLGLMTFLISLAAVKHRPKYILAPIKNRKPRSKAMKTW